jgi:hypothetical protein
MAARLDRTVIERLYHRTLPKSNVSSGDAQEQHNQTHNRTLLKSGGATPRSPKRPAPSSPRMYFCADETDPEATFKPKTEPRSAKLVAGKFAGMSVEERLLKEAEKHQAKMRVRTDDRVCDSDCDRYQQ